MDPDKEAIVYEELLARFLVNLPGTQLQPQRIWVHFQTACWFYIDHVKPRTNAKLDVDGELRRFCSKIITYWPSFRMKANQIFSIVYNCTSKISSFGAILLDSTMTRALVVDHVQRKGKFSFPKGKPNEGETGPQCAVREVWEQVSYNIRDKISPGDAISFDIRDKRVTFYIVANVGTEFIFKTKTQGEIHSIHWAAITALENDPKYKHMDQSVTALKRWIKK